MKLFLALFFGIMILLVNCSTDIGRPPEIKDTHTGHDDKSTVRTNETPMGRYNSIFDAVRKFAKGILHAGGPKDLTSRTFGMKRIQFMMMPMIYKMGVMMTMIFTLTIISLKGLLIGIILLVLKLSTILAKFYALGHNQGQQPPYAAPQPVHLYLHHAPPQPHVIENPWQFSPPMIDSSIKGY